MSDARPERPGDLEPARMRVGLAWRCMGEPNEGSANGPSLGTLRSLSSLMSEVEFLSIQTGASDEELSAWPIPLVRGIYGDAPTQVQWEQAFRKLDLVVTADPRLALHAGSMSVRVWLLADDDTQEPPKGVERVFAGASLADAAADAKEALKALLRAPIDEPPKPTIVEAPRALPPTEVVAPPLAEEILEWKASPSDQSREPASCRWAAAPFHSEWVSTGRTPKGALHASRLFELVQELEVPYGHEYSFKMTQGTLQAHRFILGIQKSSLGDGPGHRILRLCDRLGMPREQQDLAVATLVEAGVVGFGFEEGPRGCMFKLYAEMTDQFAARKDAPMLLYRGFKWDPDGSGADAVAAYTLWPGLSVGDVSERITGVFPEGGRNVSLPVVRALVAYVLERMPVGELNYKDMSEPGTVRKSFNINVYNSKIRVHDIIPAVIELARRYEMDPGLGGDLCKAIQEERVGHFCGGIDRDGNEFTTIYYGGKSFLLHPDHKPDPRVWTEVFGEINSLTLKLP